jgi:hypothetical protein
MRIAVFSLALLLGGCVIEAPPRYAPAPEPVVQPPVADAPPVADSYSQGDEPPVVDEDPPVNQPPPVVVSFAPPPLLVEVPPPMPFGSAVWVGGYWVWQGNWVWAHGHWMAPPQPELVWVHPYYEHRGDFVVFVDGHWSSPGVVFVPPPPTLRLVAAPVAFGVVVGPRPIGPAGCFIPAPPGSRRGIIVPAPIGTAPAVVTSAPAVIAPGMRVNASVHVNNNVHITNVTNVTNVTIVAPAGATATGHAFNNSVPAAPHLAAARPALVQTRAPQPNANHQWGNGQMANGQGGSGQGGNGQNANWQNGNGQGSGRAGNGPNQHPPGPMREPMPVRTVAQPTPPPAAHGATLPVPAPPVQAVNTRTPHGQMGANEPLPQQTGMRPAPAPHAAPPPAQQATPHPQANGAPAQAHGNSGSANGNNGRGTAPNQPHGQEKPQKADNQHKKQGDNEH